MKKKGYSRFNVWWFNQIWKNEIGKKKESTEYGCPLKYGHFGWYESIIPLIEDYCKKNTGRLKQKKPDTAATRPPCPAFSVLTMAHYFH